LVSIALDVLKLQALSDEELERSMTHTFDLAKECLQINYGGAKTTFQYLLPLLQLSDSPRVVNVSSALGMIKVCSFLHHH
jgi:(+)-neomenthol dehydrogenase